MSYSEINLRTRVDDADIEPMKGKILSEAEYDLLVSGPTMAWMPADPKTGEKRLLLKYLPGALTKERLEQSYETLHSLKDYETTNRGLASGTERVTKKLRDPNGEIVDGTWSYSKSVPSAIVGAFDPAGPKRYCRLTAFTAKEIEKFAGLFPLFQDIGALFAEHVPDRYAAQMKQVASTKEDWVIPGTPFTTITVNNSYPTGVHTDKGDLDEGFSTLAVLRRGDLSGGRLVFPQWRVAVDMQDGDLLLMDAHQWHGNTQLHLNDKPCLKCGERATVEMLMSSPAFPVASWRPFCDNDGAPFSVAPGIEIREMRELVPAERISVVSYYRTKMKECGTADEEAAKQVASAERRVDFGAQAVEEMAAEAVG